MIRNDQFNYLCKLLADEDDDQVDLIREVFQKVVQDDEDAKAPFYAALLDWMMQERPNRNSVRVLADAVQRLSYFELYIAIRNCKHSGRFESLSQVVLNRLVGVGMCADRIVAHHGPIPVVGGHAVSPDNSSTNTVRETEATEYLLTLARYCNEADLIEPIEAA